MNRPDRRVQISDEEIDGIIRQALWPEANLAEPPPEVWQRISRQIAAGPSPHRRPPARSLSHLFAPLMQGLAATAILLLLGLSLGPNLLWQSYQYGANGQVIAGTPIAALPEPAAPQAPAQGLVLDAGSEDMLSVGALLRYEAEVEQEKTPLMLQTAHPELDPVLVNRHGEFARP